MAIKRRSKQFSEEDRERMNARLEQLTKEVEAQMVEMATIETEIIKFMLENNIDSLELEDGTVVSLERGGIKQNG